jgi:hypothetical protein
VALLGQPSIEAAATAIGVNAATIYRWLHEPAFAEAYRTARRDALGQAIARLQQLSSGAVAVLASIAGNTALPTGARVAAASKILDTAIKAVELEDLESRITALEAQHANHNP